MQVPDGVDIHPGDNWFYHPFPISPVEDKASPMHSMACADIIIRKGTDPCLHTSHSFLLQVVKGQGYFIQGELRSGTEVTQWHARYVRPGMSLSIDRNEPYFFFVPGENDLHLFFMGSVFQCLHRDRVEVPLSELEKPLMLHIQCKITDYEGTTAKIQLEDGTTAELYNANKVFGISENLPKGQTVQINMEINWITAQAKGVSSETSTTTTETPGNGG